MVVRALVVAPLLGFVATGGPAVGRVSTSNRDPARMLLEPSAFFLLSKVDLSQFRLERETLDSVINEIDGRIDVAVVPGPAEQQAAQEAAAALAAAASTSKAATGIASLLPIPAVVVPMAALYYAWARLHGSPSGSGLIEQGGAAAKVVEQLKGWIAGQAEQRGGQRWLDAVAKAEAEDTPTPAAAEKKAVVMAAAEEEERAAAAGTAAEEEATAEPA